MQKVDEKKNRNKAVIFFAFVAFILIVPVFVLGQVTRQNMFSLGDHITRIAELREPEHPKYRGQLLDLGYEHRRYAMFWLPLGGSIEGR